MHMRVCIILMSELVYPILNSVRSFAIQKPLKIRSAKWCLQLRKSIFSLTYVLRALSNSSPILCQKTGMCWNTFDLKHKSSFIWNWRVSWRVFLLQWFLLEMFPPMTPKSGILNSRGLLDSSRTLIMFSS